MALLDSSSSLTPGEQQARWAGAVRVETPTVHATHNAVKAEDLSLFIGTRRLLANAELKIAEQIHTVDAAAGSKGTQTGTCYGLVGVNGCGKSTLLRLIAERRLPVPAGWDVFIVNQHLPSPSDNTPVDEVMSAIAKRTQLLTEQASLEEEVSKLSESNTERFEEASTRLVTLQSELSQWEGADIEVTNILRALGFRSSQQVESHSSAPTVDMPMNKLSGGWRMKVELAKAMWLKPKLLLLDEPTNHLDFQSLQWMSEQLEQYPHTSVVVSHDVNFLYGACREILWLKDLKLEYLPRTVISQEDLLRMQRARALNFHFPTPDEAGNHGLSLHGVEFSYGSCGSSSSTPQKLRVKKEVRFGGSSRAVLLGKNGSGKSTFLDLCAGVLKPTRGSIDVTPDIKIGHFSQFTDEFDKNSTDTAASYLVRNCREELAGHAGSTAASRKKASLAAESGKEAPAPPIDAGKGVNIPEKRLVEIARAVLNNFGFEGDVAVTVPIDCLSGGQKALMKFAVLSLRPAHILLLDEPTNHIDAEACEALAKGLSEFKGGVVAVTHDELLIYRLINCNWTSSELLICREGTVWRQQSLAASDNLKALTKEMRGAEDAVEAQPSDKKQPQQAPENQPASDAKQTTVVTKTELPPWLQKKEKKPRPKRGQAADVDLQESAPMSVERGADVQDTQKEKAETPSVTIASEGNETKDAGAKGTPHKKAARSSPVMRPTAKGKANARKEGVACQGGVDEESQAEPKWRVPAVLKNSTRTPIQMPNQHSSWEDELCQLRTLYGTCEVENCDDGQRIVRLTHHCTDPDWEAVNWAPTGLRLEIHIGKFYPEPPVEEPVLSVLGPKGLPDKFTKVLPLLFAESVGKAPARTAAVYRGLQFADKNMAELWRKIQAAAEKEQAEAAEKAKALKAECESDQGQSASNTTKSASVIAPGPTTAPAVPPASVAPGTSLGGSIEDVRRLGVEVRLLGLTLEGFKDLLPSLLRLQVVCDRCRKPTDIETATGIVRTALPTDMAAATGVEMACPTCKGVLALHVAPSSCHGGCEAIAHVLGTDCHAVHLLRSDFEAKCGECGEVARIRNIGPGYQKQSKCTGCSTKLNLAVDDVALLGRDVEKWRLVAEEEGDKLNSRKQLQEARRMEKGLGIKVGTPLPDKGGCKHYSKAYRWLRFPCCGRAFPCDVCHDEQTDHMHEWATKMLCGLCSQEQPFTKDSCTHCGASQNKSKGGYWEGGEGCRDRTKMAKDDPHKYKGLSKPNPKKK